MKFFSTKDKGTKPKQPKGRQWAISKVLCLSSKNKQLPLPPPVPKTVATRRTTARTKASSLSRNQNNSLEARLLADHHRSDRIQPSQWQPQPAPYDELLNHAMHTRRTIVPTPTRTTTAIVPHRGRPGYTARPPVDTSSRKSHRDNHSRKSHGDNHSRKSHGRRSEGTLSTGTTSLLDDTTLDSMSSNGSTMLDTIATTQQQQQEGCQGCEDSNRELSLFLCGKILDHAGLRTPLDSQEQQEAWDELILDLLLA